MQEEDVGTFGKVALADEVDHAGEGLAAVHRVEQDGFGLGEELHGFDHGVVGAGVAGQVVVAVADDLFLGHFDAGAELVEHLLGEVHHY